MIGCRAGGATPLARGLALAAMLLLAGCVTRAPGPGPVVTQPSVEQPGVISADSVQRLPGWDNENYLAALEAVEAACRVNREPAMAGACQRADTLQNRMARLPTPSEARVFLETYFRIEPVATADGGPGLLTSYFAPEYAARRQRTAEFDMPVRAAPSGWRNGQTLPPRAEIEATPSDGALAWMRAEDLFFMQIQGSGYLTFEDGSKARAAYAANNGRTFVGIARPMAEQGLLPQNGTSGDAIRVWLATHRGAEAQRVMALNPRYIFFRLDPDDGGQPAGAAGVPLPERRAIAVDPGQWRYGELAWIAADGGNLTGARGSYHGLVAALDTGSAIRGPVRADLYMGRGDAAGAEAGAVRHPLRMWRLVPR